MLGQSDCTAEGKVTRLRPREQHPKPGLRRVCQCQRQEEKPWAAVAQHEFFYLTDLATFLENDLLPFLPV
jgi:hypothetical protein